MYIKNVARGQKATRQEKIKRISTAERNSLLSRVSIAVIIAVIINYCCNYFFDNNNNRINLADNNMVVQRCSVRSIKRTN